MLEGGDAGGIEDGDDVREVAGGGVEGDGEFLLRGGVADAEAAEEAVELGFGEGVGAFGFEGVLGGEDHEGRFERIGFAADGDFAFLHGLEEGGLGFWRGAVDFVGEEEVGEDGSLHDDAAEAFVGFVLLQDFRAGDVCGHHVGGELDAAEVEVEGAGHGGAHEGFGDAGNA